MKIYISGPITGTTDYIERFETAEQRLATNNGNEVVNPARVNSALPASTTYRQYMDMSLLMLSMCDTIYMLKGWEQSKGAREEFAEAVKSGKKIYFEEVQNGK
jgi:hypothetical protein